MIRSKSLSYPTEFVRTKDSWQHITLWEKKTCPPRQRLRQQPQGKRQTLLKRLIHASTSSMAQVVK
ncbi:hypothetical protein CLF_113156 [Clonorchis sinensis]|uniref:Uncharacterized protein n=1 Tax=Clonorchis sinensis TaxID=79923 RepID=G7YXS2_CLOSI|nr:hypothetical protein CLF_113156 [Clonorchis sinensis]